MIGPIVRQSVLLIVLAALVSGNAPGSSPTSDVRMLFSYDDFPAYLQRAGDMSKTVYTRTTIRNDGTLQDCSVDLSSGDVKLDAYTCALIVKRGKFLPGRGRDGVAIYNVLRFPVNWTITTANPSREEMLKQVIPDLELSVNQLPKGARKLVEHTLEVEADASGHIVTCSELPPVANDRRRRFPELVPVACQQATKSLTLRPPLDRTGKATRSVQTVSVRMTLAR